MYEQVGKSKKSKICTVVNSVDQKKNLGKEGSGFVDNRAEAIVQKKLQKMTNNGQSSPTYTTGIKQVTNNRVVQCLKGAVGTAQAGQPVTYKLNPDFITKHVANNIEEAVSVTEARIETGDPPGIVAGTAPNNLAKESDWKKALDSSAAIVPPESEWWEGEWEDGNKMVGWVTRLTKVQVDGWEAIGTKGNVTAKVATNKKYLGGTWTVKNCKFDANEDYVDASGEVEMNISHLTS
ncbi:hypothetical protein [Pectobacterium versatile]|uniref:hypothetical protein n=1 Tax=Pectobacterium versatile TaxID=2488639 RepID=UPI001CF39986|nr:hypothetical protein [Pectobacterium versatile]MCA6924664.1 hypothetical protein [Pectobacterium versatile]MCH5081428.1 hypothetical protein [Pectobacterium versatile]